MVAGGYQFRGVFLPRISHQNLLDKSKTSKGKPAKTIDVLYTEKWLIMICSCGLCNSGLSIYLQRVFVFWWGVLTSSQSHGQHQSSVNECAAPPAPALAAPSRVAGDGPLSSPWCHPPTAPLALLWEPKLQSPYVDVVVYMFIVYCQLVYQIHLIQ